jgi:hypothetical protein
VLFYFFFITYLSQKLIHLGGNQNGKNVHGYVYDDMYGKNDVRDEVYENDDGANV